MGKASIHALDGRLLQLFLEVYDCNSVSRAAERLGLTQSTVSHGLERLRRSLHDPLFVREGRNIAPTAQADFLAPRMRVALAALEALNEPQDYDPRRDTRRITLALHAQDLQPQLRRFCRTLWQEAPQLPLRILHLGAARNARPLLETGEADLVIAARRGALAPELDSEPLFSDRHVVFYDPAMRAPVDTTAAYTAARHALLDFGEIVPNPSQGKPQEIEIERHGHLFASDTDTLARLMKGTDLIATLPSRLRTTSFAGFGQCPLPFPVMPVGYDMIWHQRQSLSPRLGWIRRTLHDSFAEAAQPEDALA